MKAKFVPIAAASLLLALAAPRSADACGGGVFYPQTSTTAAVTGHRVVISMSSTQTVLWDQIQYQGAPESFAWVLPVKKGARLEVATDAWIETLDGSTTKVVSSPRIECESDYSSGGCCFGGLDGAGAPPRGGDTGEPNVTVVHEETVGPYEVKTLETSMGGGVLADWLTANGYAIPADVAPILDDYVADGFDFIAMRMVPGATVDQMKPVRVITPGAQTSFPLRMLSAGTKDAVDLLLYVIAEGRIKSGNIPTVDFPHDKISYDFATEEFNYDAVRDEALAQSNGRVFLTTMARKGPLLAEYEQPGAGWHDIYHLADYYQANTIAEAYFEQGRINGELTAGGCSSVVSTAKGLAGSADKVVDLCPADGSPCGTAAAGEIDSRKFACAELEDLAVALTGMHPKDVWLTRLEARLPRAALSEDLVLVPGPAASVERSVTAASSTNTPSCPEESAAAPVLGSKGTGGRTPRGPVAAMALAFGLAVAALRRLGGRPAVQHAAAR
jgi:hypothetical protein